MEAMANIVAVVSVAGFGGVMISIGATLGSYWRSLPAEEFLRWFERNNRFVARAVPPTVVPALFGVGGSLVVAWGTPDAWLWAVSGLGLGASLVLTAAYFVPANTAFADGRVPPVEVPDRLQAWLRVHVARIALALGSAVVGGIAMRG